MSEEKKEKQGIDCEGYNVAHEAIHMNYKGYDAVWKAQKKSEDNIRKLEYYDRDSPDDYPNKENFENHFNALVYHFSDIVKDLTQMMDDYKRIIAKFDDQKKE